MNWNGFWRCFEFRRCPAWLIMELGLRAFVTHSLLRDTPVVPPSVMGGRHQPYAHLHGFRAALLAHNPSASSTVVLADRKYACEVTRCQILEGLV